MRAWVRYCGVVSATVRCQHGVQGASLRHVVAVRVHLPVPRGALWRVSLQPIQLTSLGRRVVFDGSLLTSLESLCGGVLAGSVAVAVVLV